MNIFVEFKILWFYRHIEVMLSKPVADIGCISYITGLFQVSTDNVCWSKDSAMSVF